MQIDYNFWMRLALEEAERAMQNGEIPVATIILANGKEVTRSQTQVARHGGNLSAHGELLAILGLEGRIWALERPLVLITTLEPCLMCLGAAMQVAIDEIVYGMDAAPDGGSQFADAIIRGGQKPPKITPHVLEEECLAQMKRLPQVHPNHGAIDYVKAMLAAYEVRKR
ncbi:MAG: nucleoside deaminase [Chloroflexi bacterium]|nr:nucleoside deaminase [Chloroflexota bacterium]